jgi:hypothetical protein
VNFKELVAPLAARKNADADWETGSGFLIRVAGQIYLVTTAHIANYEKDQKAEWSKWSPELYLVDESKEALAKVPLFDETTEVRIPLFKYFRATDEPERILDLILLPVAAGELMASMTRIFTLPDEKATYAKNDKVVMFGRRDPWPYLNVTTHRVSLPAPAIMHMEPEGQKGDSGAPVLTPTGSLVGMNYGHGNAEASGAMIISAELIELAATTTDGYVPGWTYQHPVPQTHNQP